MEEALHFKSRIDEKRRMRTDAESSDVQAQMELRRDVTVGSGDCLPVFRSPEKGVGRHYTVKMRTTKSPFSQVSTNIPQTVQYVKKKLFLWRIGVSRRRTVCFKLSRVDRGTRIQYPVVETDA